MKFGILSELIVHLGNCLFW